MRENSNARVTEATLELSMWTGSVYTPNRSQWELL
jgi:hypothetical protein